MTTIAAPIERSRGEQVGCDEIAFDCPWQYNAARILFDNLDRGRGAAPAIVTDSGQTTYAALCASANQIGNTLLASGLLPGERVLLFMDDEPAYAAAVMGAMKAGLVPVLINTLSPADLVRFYLQDSGATAAVISEPHLGLFGAVERHGTQCQTVIHTGMQRADGSDRSSHGWGKVTAPDEQLAEAPTTRDDMAFWMYSSGSTGRPKGIVHRHEDLLYTDSSYAKHVLKLGLVWRICG